MGDEPPPDAEPDLLRRAKAGDTSAFDGLVAIHRNNVYMQAYSICRNEDDAIEITQETFVRAWRALAGFGGKPNFGGWLRRIATNAAIDLCRSRARRPTVPLNEDLGVPDVASRTTPAAFERPGHSLDRQEIAARVEEAFTRLSPEHRAVIVLKEIDDLSYREIAEATGTSLGTVMSRLFYARRKLQSLLADLKP